MYKFKKNNMKVLCYVWSEKEAIEENTLEQCENISSLPFVFHHTAIMPDAHLGKGCCIGSVFATKNIIIPHAIGSDIGCGLCAVKTSLTDIDRETLKKIMGEIRKVIPVGFNKHKEEQDENLMPDIKVFATMDAERYLHLRDSVCVREFSNARKSLGTLGGGNHFIEIQKGSDGYIWIMIHSGSRNLGKQVADHYNKLAIKLNEKWHSQVPKEWELAFLPVDSEEGQAYIREMNYCVEFALANRKLMQDRIINIFNNITECDLFSEFINIAHNYASLENHFGQNVWVHRKGATQAKKKQLGIIPGSQGTASYIVKGKGNLQSFMSCSHGAGRVMGRKQAIRELDLEKEIKILDDQNIIHGIRHQTDLDESVSCYKDISKVIAEQSDLIEILVKLKPLAVIKG